MKTTDNEIGILIFQILKFTSLIISSLVGLIGILSETKDKKTHKLTKSGKTLILLLIISGIIAIASQSFEIYFKQREDIAYEKQRVETQKSLDSILDKATIVGKNSEKSLLGLQNVSMKQGRQLKSQKELFFQNSRLQSQLFPFELGLDISYPSNYPGFQDYLERLRETHLHPNKVVFSIPVLSGTDDAPRSDGYEYPATMISEPFIYIHVFKKGHSLKNAADLILYGGSDRSEYSEGIQGTETSYTYSCVVNFRYNVFHSSDPITSNVSITNPLVEIDNGKIFSFLDLNDATILVEITNAKSANPKLNNIRFQFKNGRRIESTVKIYQKDQFDWKQDENSIVYRVKLKASNSGVSRIN